MKNYCSIFLAMILSMAVLAWPAAAQTGNDVVITSPHSGDGLQGTVTITGSTIIDGFLSAEIAFAYTGDTTGTWFLVSTVDHPVKDGLLATWDTASITDGNYTLRMRVYLLNGTFRDATATQLRVRNYTPMETPTPAPTAIQPTTVPTITLTPTPFPTPTMLPTNNAVLTPQDVSIHVGYGGVAALVVLALISLYLWLKRKI
jgi:hypothetical protein